MNIWSLRKPRKATKSYFNKIYVVNKVLHNMRFTNRPPLPGIRFLPEHRNVLKMAIDLWYRSVRDQLTHIILNQNCAEVNILSFNKYNCFNWSYGSFLNRVKLDSRVWIDILLLRNSVQCLEKQKLKIDLSEVMKFLNKFYKLIIKTVVRRSKDNLQKKLWHPLVNAERYSIREVFFASVHSALLGKINDLQKQIIELKVEETLKAQDDYIAQLEDEFSNADVLYPIELRYALSYYRNMRSQRQYHAEVKQNYYKELLTDIKSKTNNEKVSSVSVLNTYYADIEDYKIQLKEYQKRFDTDLDDLDNENALLQGDLQRLHEKKKKSLMQIETFHYEIKRRLALEERRRIEAEKKQLAENDAIAAAIAEAAKKEKNRKQDKKRKAPPLKPPKKAKKKAV